MFFNKLWFKVNNRTPPQRALILIKRQTAIGSVTASEWRIESMKIHSAGISYYEAKKIKQQNQHSFVSCCFWFWVAAIRERLARRMDNWLACFTACKAATYPLKLFQLKCFEFVAFFLLLLLLALLRVGCPTKLDSTLYRSFFLQQDLFHPVSAIAATATFHWCSWFMLLTLKLPFIGLCILVHGAAEPFYAAGCCFDHSLL